MKNFTTPEFTVDADMISGMEQAYAHKVSHSGNLALMNMNIEGRKNVEWSETYGAPLLMKGSKKITTNFTKSQV